jgi:hypothetical protein
MQLAKGIKLEQGTTIILTDDQYVPALQPKLGVHMDRLKFLSPWPEFQSYVSFKDESLFKQASGVYVSHGNLQIKVNFESKKLIDMNSETTFRIVKIITISGIQIITIPGMIITQALMDRFVAAYWVFVGPNVFRLLAKQANPRDVVRLCGANQKLRAWCNDNFYAEMLQHHYQQTSKNPGETFRDLVSPAIYDLEFDGSRPMTRDEIPRLLDGDKFIAISSADYNSNILLLTKNGDVWSRGMNYFGQLGSQSQHPEQFYKLHIMKNIISIKMTEYDSYFLDKSGTLWACGLSYTARENDDGAIEYIYDNDGIPLVIDRNVATFSIPSVSTQGPVGLYKDGTGFIIITYPHGENEPMAIPIPTPKTIDHKPIRAVTIEKAPDLLAYLDKNGVVWLQMHDISSNKPPLSRLTPFTNLPIIRSIKFADKHLALLDVEGNVWISTPRHVLMNKPERVEGLSNIVSISSNDIDRFVFLDAKGNVQYMQISGNVSDDVQLHTLIPISMTTEVVAVSVGPHYMNLLT